MHTMEYAAKSARSCILCQTLTNQKHNQKISCVCVSVCLCLSSGVGKERGSRIQPQNLCLLGSGRCRVQGPRFLCLSVLKRWRPDQHQMQQLEATHCKAGQTKMTCRQRKGLMCCLLGCRKNDSDKHFASRGQWTGGFATTLTSAGRYELYHPGGW